MSPARRRAGAPTTAEPAAELPPMFLRGIRQTGLELNRAQLRGTWTPDGRWRELAPGERWGSPLDVALCDLVSQRRRCRWSPHGIATLIETHRAFEFIRAMFREDVLAAWHAETSWERWSAMRGGTEAGWFVVRCGRSAADGDWAGGWFVARSAIHPGGEPAPHGEQRELLESIVQHFTAPGAA